MPVVVDDILNKPFLFRTRDEKLRIVAQGKPRPFVKTAAVISFRSKTDGGTLQMHQFNLSMYDDIQWLTGCEKRNTFFCWPCLLFNLPFGLWNSSGVADLAYLMEDLDKHVKSVEHVSATSKLQKLEKQSNAYLKDQLPNTSVKRNQEILRRLTDVVCSLLTKEQPFYVRKNGCQLDLGTCVEKLLFLRTYDTLNCNYIEDAVNLIKTSPNIIHDLVNALAKMVKLSIRREIQSSTYVSIILNDHSKITYKSQISTVLRYIKDGKVLEKFIGFLNMGDKKNLEQMGQHILNTVAQFGLSGKLVAVSLDGGMLPLDDLRLLKTWMKENLNAEQKNSAYPFLVPWYCHNVENVLLQSLIKIKACAQFIEVMQGMKCYFLEKSIRVKFFKSFVLSNLPSLRNTKWFNHTQFTLVVHTYRKYFIQFFESILQNSATWEADDVIKALGFQQILKEFDTVFLLEVFAKLFEIINFMTDVLDKSFSPAFLNVEICRRFSEANDNFNDVWQSLKTKGEDCSELLGSALKKFKSDHSNFPASKAPEYRQLYLLMVKCALNEFDTRYADLSNLKFCQLLISDKYDNFKFDNEWLQSLLSFFGTHFDEVQTRNELNVLYANAHTFPKKTLSDFLDFIIKMQLQNDFKCVCKLAELVLTLPIKPVTEEGDRTKFDEINDWSYISAVLGIQTGDICLPCIEIEYLQESQKSDTFYDDIAELFYESNRTLGLLLK